MTLAYHSQPIYDTGIAKSIIMEGTGHSDGTMTAVSGLQLPVAAICVDVDRWRVGVHGMRPTTRRPHCLPAGRTAVRPHASCSQSARILPPWPLRPVRMGCTFVPSGTPGTVSGPG